MQQQPVGVTIAVALFVLGGTLVTAGLSLIASWQSAKAAREAASATARASTSAARISSAAEKFNVQSPRFAAWQMHKREVYGKLLASIREASDQPDEEHLREMWACFERALVVADDELFEMLHGLRVWLPSDERGRPFPAAPEWRRLIWAMKQDVELEEHRWYPRSEGWDAQPKTRSERISAEQANREREEPHPHGRVAEVDGVKSQSQES